MLVLTKNLKEHVKASWCSFSFQRFTYKAAQVSINEPVREAKKREKKKNPNMFRAGKRGQCQKPFQMRERATRHVFLFRMSDVTDGTLKLFSPVRLSASSFLHLRERARRGPSSRCLVWRCHLQARAGDTGAFCQRGEDLPRSDQTIRSSTTEFTC